MLLDSGVESYRGPAGVTNTCHLVSLLTNIEERSMELLETRSHVHKDGPFGHSIRSCTSNCKPSLAI